MIPELGHYALILALCFALIQASLPLLGTIKLYQPWLDLAKPAAYGQFIFLSVSFICLAYAFVSNDFSVTYVAQNSNSLLPLPYKLAAVWGAHEGSLLLWVYLLSFWTLLVCRFSRQIPTPMLTRILAILGFISIGFLLFILSTSDPFARLLPNFPSDGLDLNPLLQDPGLAIHPPMLYMGYVGFSVAFAFAIAALLSGELDQTWARWARPWTLAAWCFLTLGIVLGSGWAYRVLGWGGWWFWDPVENASFLPWLTGTALIHALIVTEKRGLFKAWTVLLAICAFSLSLMGTFLVRSGILVSVHAFATDPSRGAYMLKFLFLVISTALLLFAWRAPKLKPTTDLLHGLSRETFILSNNIILLVMMLTVLIGTLYPLILDAFNLGKISVGPPYFNTVFIPLAIPLFLLMGAIPLLRWHQTSPQQVLNLLWVLLSTSIGLGLLLPFIFTQRLTIDVVLGTSLSCWIILTIVRDIWLRARTAGWRFQQSVCAMWIAHFGVAICILGISWVSAYHIERDVRISLHEQVSLGSYQFQLTQLSELQGPNYSAIRAHFDIFNADQKIISRVDAEKRLYTVQQIPMTKAAMAVNLWRDLYVALGEPLPDGSWSVRLYYKPLIRWIWGGGLLMLLGGLLAMTDRRYRRQQS